MKRLVLLLLLAGICGVRGFAAQTAYVITFTGSSPIGTPLPSGAFVYDPDAGFSSFLVAWNGVVFDLTSLGNAPYLADDPATGCDSAASNHRYGFIFMSQTAVNCLNGAPAQYAWAGQFYGGSIAQFMLILSVSSGLAEPEDRIGATVIENVPAFPPMDFVVGGWSIAEVPEPSTAAAGGVALLLLAGMTSMRRPRTDIDGTTSRSQVS